MFQRRLHRCLPGMWCEKTKHRIFTLYTKGVVIKCSILCSIIFFSPLLLPYRLSKSMFRIMVLTLLGITTVPQNNVAIKFSIHCFIIFLLLLPYSPSKSMFQIMVLTLLGITAVPQNSVAIKFSKHCFIIFLLLLLPYSPSKSMLWIVVFTALGTLQRLLAQSRKK